MLFEDQIHISYKQGELPEKLYRVFLQLYKSYASSIVAEGMSLDVCDSVFKKFLEFLIRENVHPTLFEPLHIKITSPIDYQEFGLSFVRPLVIQELSTVKYIENIKRMVQQVEKGENVILFANHQTEVDPQLLILALEDYFPQFGRNIFFVAGDRVVSDPLAIPISKGCNLLCIFSKRHIDNPPEKKHEKQLHNQKTMKRMSELLQKGGHCIYVAPSGGRDRANAQGEVHLSPFDPQSIEMFRLMAKQAKTPTHFYPLALSTYAILPPPQTIEVELGEMRIAQREGTHFVFGEEIDMENFPGADIPDKHAKREARAAYIQSLVEKEYVQIKGRP